MIIGAIQIGEYLRMTEILEIFKSYNGTGYYCILFIAALLYLWFTEEDRNVRALLIITPAIIQVLFFIPYFYMLYNALDEGTYYRILWLLPMTIVIAYSGCKVMSTHIKMGTALIAVILVLSGTCVYTSKYMSPATNPYHLPDEVVEICEMIEPEEGRERVWAAVPITLVHYIRQYTTTIQLPFGRDSMVEAWTAGDNALYNLYMQPSISASDLADLSTQYYCNYVILEKEQVIEGKLESYALNLMGETDNYLIYRNNNVPFWDEVPVE